MRRRTATEWSSAPIAPSTLSCCRTNAATLRAFLVARTNHKRRFTSPKSREMLFDGSFPQFCAIGKLFDNSVLFQFCPSVLKPARFEILDRCFECRHLLPLGLK